MSHDHGYNQTIMDMSIKGGCFTHLLLRMGCEGSSGVEVLANQIV